MASSSGSSRTGKEVASSSHSHRTEKEASSSCTPNSDLGERGKEVAETRNWVDGLPYDVAVAILQKVGSVDILNNVQKVCVSWRKICQDPALWRSIDIYHHDNIYTPNDLVEMTKHAFDRSCGQLTDISLEGFGDDDLLQYLTDRKNQLKCLRIVKCRGISDKGLSLAAMKLPSLEELHIYFGSITHIGLESVGRSCPSLKSLTYNLQGRMPYLGFQYDEEFQLAYFYHNYDIFAISTCMSELRHLSLFGNRMSSKDLQAILNGCPYLESLDLRQCFRVKLPTDGELYKRCSSIKVFRPPYDSADDYDFNPTFSHDNYDDNYDLYYAPDGYCYSRQCGCASRCEFHYDYDDDDDGYNSSCPYCVASRCEFYWLRLCPKVNNE